jgi:hypothetical protein
MCRTLLLMESLDDLDQGEIPEVFTPSKTRRRDAKPAQVRRLQLKPVCPVMKTRRPDQNSFVCHQHLRGSNPTTLSPLC